MSKSLRMWRSEMARKRRRTTRELREGLKERLYSKLRREKRKNK